MRGTTRSAWPRGQVRVAVAFVVGALAVAGLRGAAPGRELGALAAALSREAGGERVAPSEIRWEPSGGDLADLVLGRRVLFLAGDEARDVWRARVRVAPEGTVLQVVDAHDLTSTPLGDDHQLVVRGSRAAFATRSYGQEQSVTVLDLAGDPTVSPSSPLGERVMTALADVQRTGALAGIGRVDLILESPARSVGLSMGDAALDITLLTGDPRRPAVTTAARFDLARGTVEPAAGIRVDVVTHVPKRFSHWVVDTLRAVPWIGAAPIAWAEDQALAARDAWRRLAFRFSGSSRDVLDPEAPAAPAAVSTPAPGADRSSAEPAAPWPPPRVPTIWKTPEPGEGEWVVPAIPWLRRPPGAGPDAPSAFYETFVRPDPERPYARVLLVAMDTRQLDLDMEAGVEDPEPLTGPPGSGRIPRDPAIYTRVAAAFNGAFKTEHGHYGMMVHKRVLLPPVPGAATVAVLDDGRVGFGTWGADRKIGGIAGVDDDAIVSFRQNLDPLVDRGRVNPTGRNLWGFTLPGKGAQTERSGLCVTTGGQLVYAWGDDLSATALARAMAAAGCDFAMHLDMNPYHTGFLFAAIDELPARWPSPKLKTALLSTSMSIPVDRYIQYAPKDFFYVAVRDPRPAALPGAAAPWRPDGGTQPPPGWLPGIWTSQVDGPEGPIELVDVEPDRAAWKVRAGAADAPAATSLLRELTPADTGGGRAVLLAAGLGVALERRPLGLATDGRLGVAVRDEGRYGVLFVGADGRLAITRATEAPVLGPHDDLVELPVALWDGQPVAVPAGATGSGSPAALRSALGVTPSGRVVLARARATGVEPLAAALARAGCARALVLDRGREAAGRLERAGTSTPPGSRYDETVLFALGLPLAPRGFRFEASTPVPAGAAGQPAPAQGSGR